MKQLICWVTPTGDIVPLMGGDPIKITLANPIARAFVRGRDGLGPLYDHYLTAIFEAQEAEDPEAALIPARAQRQLVVNHVMAWMFHHGAVLCSSENTDFYVQGPKNQLERMYEQLEAMGAEFGANNIHLNETNILDSDVKGLPAEDALKLVSRSIPVKKAAKQQRDKLSTGVVLEQNTQLNIVG